MERVDLYTAVHKGIRVLLFDAATHVARTEFADPAEAASVHERLVRLASYLDEHSEHEDDVIQPELDRIAPEAHADLRSTHARLHGLQAEILQLASRLGKAGANERVALGRRIHARIWPFVAEHLRHMEHEECAVNRLLWAHRTDEELALLRRMIVSSLPPGRYAEWLGLMLPAMAPSERVGLLRGLSAGVSGERFAELTIHARAALGDKAWSATLDAVRRAAAEPVA